MLRFLASIVFLSSFLWAGPAELSQAENLYNQAVDLMKVDHRANAGKSLALLKASRKLYLAETQLSNEDEATLMKINSHIYWQSKFSTGNDLKESERLLSKSDKVIVDKKKEVEEAPQVQDEEFQQMLAEKKKAFSNDLKNAQAYEQQHKNDAMSNMLNYLDLQMKVIDVEKALEMLSKTERYNTELLKEREEIIAKTMEDIPDFKGLLLTKDYDAVFKHLVRTIKLGKMDPRESGVIRMFAMEMKAMVTLKKRLISHGNSKALPIPRSYGGIEGIVTNIEANGLQILSRENEPGFLNWNVVSEQSILGLGLQILNDSNPDDIYILALANLRLENYEDAYSYFQKLIALSPDNYLRYRDYLSICETGYRLKFGPKFEEIFLKVDKLSRQGKRGPAIELLIQLKNDYLSSDLGSSYIERFRLIYSDVLRT